MVRRRRGLASSALVVVAALALACGAVGAQSPTVTVTLLRVSFSSPSRGVGLFLRAVGSGSGAGRCTLFTRTTTDAGVNFEPTHAPILAAACGSEYPADQIAGDGAGDLFAYGPGLIESHNDGTSWQRVRLGGTIVALSAVGRAVWALRVSGCQPGSGVCLLTLLVSADAGRSWRAAVHQPPRRRFPWPLTGVQTSDSTWMLRSSATAATIVLPPAPRSAAAIVEQTRDDGGSWTATTAPCFAGAFAIEYSVAPSGARWIACAAEPGAGAQQKTFARSLGPGLAWQRGLTCAIGTRCEKGMPIGGYLGGLVAISAETAFYVGGRSSLTTTRNGGRSWAVEPGFSGDASGTAEVTFVGIDDGWAVDQGFGGHAALWRTDDGGARWTRLPNP